MQTADNKLILFKKSTVVTKVAVWFHCDGIDNGGASPEYFVKRDYEIPCHGSFWKSLFVFVVGGLFGFGIPICYYQILKHHKTVCLAFWWCTNCNVDQAIWFICCLFCCTDYCFSGIEAKNWKLWKGLDDTWRKRNAQKHFVFVPCVQAKLLVRRGESNLFFRCNSFCFKIKPIWIQNAIETNLSLNTFVASCEAFQLRIQVVHGSRNCGSR